MKHSSDLNYLGLSPNEQIIFEKGNLSDGHAKVLFKIKSTVNRRKVLEYIVNNRLNVKESEKLYNKLFVKNNRSTKSYIPNDIRLFINSIDYTVSRMRSAGIDATSNKRETDEFIECVIRIPRAQKTTR